MLTVWRISYDWQALFAEEAAPDQETDKYSNINELDEDIMITFLGLTMLDQLNAEVHRDQNYNNDLWSVHVKLQRCSSSTSTGTLVQLQSSPSHVPYRSSLCPE